MSLPGSKPTAEELKLGADGQFNSMGHYMRARMTKLMHQVHSNAPHKSNLFNSISIYVNGHTDPPASSLRGLVVANGGEYHHIFQYGRTTYTIASALSASKWASLRPRERVIRPDWILDSIRAGRLLPDEPYLLINNNAREKGLSKIHEHFKKVVTSKEKEKKHPPLPSQQQYLLVDAKHSKGPKLLEPRRFGQLPKVDSSLSNAMVRVAEDESGHTTMSIGLSAVVTVEKGPPSKECIDKLKQLYQSLLDTSNLRAVRSTFVFMERRLLGDEKWAAPLNELREYINEECLTKFGAHLLVP